MLGTEDIIVSKTDLAFVCMLHLKKKKKKSFFKKDKSWSVPSWIMKSTGD